MKLRHILSAVLAATIGLSAGTALADDHEGDLVLLARNAWHLDDLTRDWPDLNFAATKDQT